MEFVATVAGTAVTDGDFRADLDTEQLAFTLQGLMLGYHHAARLMRDPKALEHTRQALDQLLEASARLSAPRHTLQEKGRQGRGIAQEKHDRSFQEPGTCAPGFRYAEYVAPGRAGRAACDLWFTAPPRMADLALPERR